MDKFVKNKKFWMGIFLMSGAILFLFYLCQNAKIKLISTIVENGQNYYFLMLLIIICSFFAVWDRKVFITYIITLFAFFAWFSFSDEFYSPADETMNYECINHIIEQKTLPTFEDKVDSDYLYESGYSYYDLDGEINYEAVQAPLYYILYAFLGGWIQNGYARFHFFRLISLLSIWIVFYFLRKSIDLLIAKKLINIDEKLYRAMLLITIFNPAYLYRASRVNNEILVCVLCSIILYISIRCLINGYSKKYYWILSLLCILCFLTKNTAIYVYITIFIIAFIQGKLKKVILPIGITGLVSLPWFLFNYRTYNSLTAMRQHLEYVYPIQNPNKVPQDLFNAVFNIFTGTYFTAEEVQFSNGEILWMNILLGLIFIVFSFIIKSTISNIGLEKVKNGKIEKIESINLICIALVLGCIFCLIAGTISTKIISVRGRYFYSQCICLIILFLVNSKDFEYKYIRMFICVISITMGIVNTSFIVDSLNRLYSSQDLYAKDLKQISLVDITDEEWENGFSKQDNVMLVKYDSTKKYEMLVGRMVSVGEKHAIIVGISNEKREANNKCIEIYTSSHLQNETNNTVILGEKYELENYNSYNVNDMIENINGREIVQSLEIRNSGRVYGISIPLATYGEDDYMADYLCTISNSRDKDVIGEYRENILIKDNSSSIILFDTPIDVEKGQVLWIKLKYTNLEGLPLAVRCTNNDQYKDGTLYYDGREKDGLDLGISLYMGK